MTFILLASSTTLLLAAWKIIKRPDDEWKSILFLIVTETIPTFVITVYLMRKNNVNTLSKDNTGVGNDREKINATS